MADWSSEKIQEVVTKIKDDEFVLPVIQRRLVWKEEAMINLFNSALKGHSFGAIIGLEEEKILYHCSHFANLQKMAVPAPQLCRLRHFRINNFL